jgi:gliding motility-associated-like protein
LSDPSIANPLAIVNATTTYTVIITDSACGTSKELKTTITVGNISVKAGKDTAVCGAKPIQLNATGATTYVWTPATGLSNPNIANPIANPTVTTTYVVTGTSTDNCSAKDTIIVSVNPSRFLSINPNKTICKGTPVQLEAMGGDSYAWYPVTGLSNPNIANPIATVDSSITYTVTITDLQCNVKKELMTSIIMSAAEVTIQEPGEITCATPSIVLNASGATRYEWRPVNGLSNPGIANPVVSIDTSTTYIVKGYTNNCIDYDTVTVIVSKTDNNRSKLEIPNAFTPNNDGNNDCFGLGRFAASAQSAQLSVYNRWGQRIFYTTDPFKCWDGTINGVKQDSGGYMYLINVRTFCGSSATKKGIALLLR